MTELIDFSEYRRRGGGKQRTYFDQGELRQLLAMYSVRVSTGEWRDYAIDFNGPLAVFSIFRHTHETPLFAGQFVFKANKPIIEKLEENCGSSVIVETDF